MPSFQLPRTTLLEPPLGTGGAGTVYPGHESADKSAARAIKLFRPGACQFDLLAAAIDRTRRDEREDSPFVRVFEYDFLGPTPYVIMELLARMDDEDRLVSRSLVRAGPGLNPRERMTLLARLAEELAQIHAAGSFHGNVRPGNIFILEDRSMALKLGDYGQLPPPAAPVELRHAPFYSAPELWRDPTAGRDPARGARWDVYSFGVVAYELMTGRLPRLQSFAFGLRRSSPAGTAAAPTEDRTMTPERLAELTDQGGAVTWRLENAIDPKLRDLISRCLELTPARRPKNMEDVWEELKLQLPGHRSRVVPATLAVGALGLTAWAVTAVASGAWKMPAIAALTSPIAASAPAAGSPPPVTPPPVIPAAAGEETSSDSTDDENPMPSPNTPKGPVANISDWKAQLKDVEENSASDYATRIELARRILAAKPDDQGAWASLTDALLSDGRQDDLAAALKTWEAQPGADQNQITELRAKAAVAKGDYKAALPLYEAVLKAEENDQEARRALLDKLAEIDLELDNKEGALKRYNKILSMHGVVTPAEDARTMLARMRLQQTLRHWNDAWDDAQAANALAPNSSEVKGQFPLAEKLHNVLTKRDPNSPEGDPATDPVAAAALLLQAGFYDAAFATIEDVQKTLPKEALRPRLIEAEAHFMAGHRADGLALDVLESRPDVLLAVIAQIVPFDAAVVAANAGSDPAAKAKAYYDRAFFLNKYQQYRLALADADASIAAEPGMKNMAYLEKIFALDKMSGRDTEAINLANKYLAENPNDSTAWAYKGMIEDGLTRYRAALRSYERAVAIAPTFAPVKSRRDMMKQVVDSLPPETEEEKKAAGDEGDTAPAVTPPPAKTDAAPADVKTTKNPTLRIAKSGALLLDGQSISVVQLNVKLRQAKAANPNLAITVSAEEGAKAERMGEVEQLLATLRIPADVGNGPPASKTAASEASDPANYGKLLIGKTGTITFRGQTVTLVELTKALRETRKEHPNFKVRIFADSGVTPERLAEVRQLLSQLKIQEGQMP